MSSIKIDVNNIKSTNQSLKILSSELTDLENSLSSIRLSLDHRIAQRGNIDQRLNQTVKSMNELEMKLKKMHIFIEESMYQYIEVDKKAKSHPLKKEKSIWNQFSDGLTTAYDNTKGFVSGLSDSVVSTVDGLWQVIRHPVKTEKGLVYVVEHPVKTGEAIWQSIKDSWNKDVINGDAESSSHWFGRAFGEAALALVGTKGVDKAIKLTRGTELIEEVGGVQVTYVIQDGGKLVNSSNKVNINNSIIKDTAKIISHPVLDNTRFGSALKNLMVNMDLMILLIIILKTIRLR